MCFQYFPKFRKRRLNIYVISYVVPNFYTNKAKSAIYMYIPGLGSSTVDQVLKYTKYPKYIPSKVLVKYSFF